MNKKLYLDGLRQLKIPGIIGVVLMSVIAFFTAWGNTFLERASHARNEVGNYINMQVTEVDFRYYTMIFLISGLIFVPVMVLVQFNFLHRRNSSDFYHSIPVRRETLYLSYMAAVFSWALSIILIPMSIMLIVYALDVYKNLQAGQVLMTLLTAVIIALMTMGAFSIGVSATGTGFTNFMVSVLILLVPRSIMIAVVSVISEQVFTLSVDYITGFFGIRWNILFDTVFNQFGMLWSADKVESCAVGPILYSTFLSITYLGLGLIVFKKRPSEVAGSPNYNVIWQTVTRLMPAFCISAIGTLILEVEIIEEECLDADILFWIFFLYAVSVVFYFLYELITSKKWKSLGKAAKALPLLLLINVVLFLLAALPTKFYRQDFYDSKKVTAVRFVEMNSSNDILDAIWENAGAISDRETVEIVTEAYNNTLTAYYHSDTNPWETHLLYEQITVDMKMNGITVRRNIYISETQANRLEVILKQKIQEGAIKPELPKYSAGSVWLRMDFGNLDFESVSLGSELTLSAIYETFRSEMNTMTTLPEELNAQEVAALYVHFQNDSLRIPISRKTPKTLHMVMNIASIDTKKEIENTLEVLAVSELNYLCMNLHTEGQEEYDSTGYDTKGCNAEKKEKIAELLSYINDFSKDSVGENDTIYSASLRFQETDGEYHSVSLIFCMDEAAYDVFITNYLLPVFSE